MSKQQQQNQNDDDESNSREEISQSNNNNNDIPRQNDIRPVALFVLFQHGSHGRPGALAYLKERMMQQFVLKCPKIKAVKFFDTRVNAFLSSDDGTVICGQRLVAEMAPEMEKFANEHEKKLRLVFSCIGLSYGGILVREMTFRMQHFHKKLSDRFEWDMLCTIASPHCGVTELPNWKKGLGKFIGWCFSKTYDELLLTDKSVLADYMINDEHINSLKVWRTRLLVANVNADKLVAFGTSSLMMDSEERKKHLEETSMLTSTVTGIANLASPMNPVADTNEESADMLAKEVVDGEKGNTTTTTTSKGGEEEVASPTTTAVVQGSKAVNPAASTERKDDKDAEEHNLALKIAKKLRSSLNWKVIAVKPDSYFETAHHAVVGSSWISKPINDAMDQIGNKLCESFGGIVKSKEEQQDNATTTPANVLMPAAA